MKRFIQLAATALILLYGNSLHAQATGNGTNKALLAVFETNTQRWKEAYNSKNAQNLVSLYTEDARYISSHVDGLELIGRDKVIANFQNGINGGGHIDQITILTARSSGNLATLLCQYQATNSGETVKGRNLLVLKKVQGKWLIAIHMTVV